MFVGHYALGFAAKRLAPRTNLGTLFAAPTLADLLWPVFLLLGWEQVRVVPNQNPFLVLVFDGYPLSHSLLTLIGWGVVFGFLYRVRTGYARGAAVIALLVVSHWVLDYITHRPDMPLYPGGPQVGLGLWNSMVATLTVEGLMLMAGVGIYARVTRARDGFGRWGLVGFVLLLAGSYVSTLLAPTPPDPKALAIGAIIFGWLFVLLGGWVDRHRDAVVISPAPWPR
jgi:membrane-bound metal-dependent hydrolase YbcI (DUF457 family)